MKKKYFLLLSVILALSLVTGCGEKNKNNEKTDKQSQESVQNIDKESEEHSDNAIEKTTIYDENSIKIVAESLKPDEFSPDSFVLDFLVENHSEKNISTAVTQISLDGVLLEDYDGLPLQSLIDSAVPVIEVPANSSIETNSTDTEGYYLSDLLMDAANISEFNTMTINMTIFDSDSQTTLYKTSNVDITVNNIK